MTSAIDLEGVTFRYAGRKRPALHEVSFTVPEGETVLVLGPSGCGKSTLALCLNGMIPHAIAGELSGGVRVHGLAVGNRPLAETVRQVGIVFQDPEAQFCMMRVDEEIAFGLENLAVPSAAMPGRIARALELTGLDCAGSHRIDWLSGGNKQRLALACVLAMEPSILVFDEPTSNLDPAGARAVFATLARLRALGRHTIVVVEHRLDHLMGLVDRVLVLGPEGSLIDDGEPHQVLERQATALDRFGIWKPQVSELAEELRSRGYTLRPYPITIAEAERAVAPLLRSGPTAVARPLPADTPVSADSAVRIHGLSSAYGRGPEILHDVSLEIRSGDFLALVGPNGAGKSTLAHHLIASLPPPRGTVFLSGRDIRTLPASELARTVGYVFQNPEHQFVATSVFDDLAFGLRLRQLPEGQVRTRVETMLADFGLLDVALANPFQLSHGEKRRLSVATMLILGQRLLVLDEPTFGQDRRHAAALLARFTDVNRAGTTILMITHDMRLVAEHARRAAVMTEGRIVACARTADLFQNDDLLRKAHLDVPPILELSRRLFDNTPGLHLPVTVASLAALFPPRSQLLTVATDPPGAREVGMRLQLFYEVDSFLHRVNPLTKLLFTIGVMVMLTLIVDPLTPLAVAALGLPAIVLLGNVPLGQTLRTLRPFVIVSFGLFWTTAMFYATDPGSTPRPLVTWGPLLLTEEGAAYGAAITFRILAIFVTSLLFTLTTDPTALLQALIQQWHISPRFGYGIIAAYRFIPLFDGQLASIRAAHRVRGVPQGGGPAAHYRRLVGHMVPLLAGGIRHAERVALAMDARGFGASSRRTFYKRSSFGRRDVIFAAGAGLVLASLLLGLHAAGWLGQPIPPFLKS